jgi:hypothetical protein
MKHISDGHLMSAQGGTCAENSVLRILLENITRPHKSLSKLQEFNSAAAALHEDRVQTDSNMHHSKSRSCAHFCIINKYIQLKKREAGAADLPIGADCAELEKKIDAPRDVKFMVCIAHDDSYTRTNLKSTHIRSALGSDRRRRHTQEFAIYRVYVTGRALIYCIPKHHCSLISLRICREPLCHSRALFAPRQWH